MPVVKSIVYLFLFYLIARPFDAVALPHIASSLALEPLLLEEFALQAGQLDQAAAYALQVAKQMPENRLMAQRATHIAFLANNTDIARQALVLWRARAPGALAVRSAQAALALRLHEWGDAQRILRLLLQDRQSGSWEYALMAILDGGNDVATLSTVLDALIRQSQIPNQFEIWQEFGQLALRLDQPKLTNDVISELAQRFPNEPRVVLLQAAYLQRTERLGEAVMLLKRVEPQAIHHAPLRTAIALAYEGMNRSADAQRVLAKGPQDMQSYSLRASLLVSQADHVGLRQLYQRLVKTSVGIPAERFTLLGRIAEYIGEYVQALHWYQRIGDGPLSGQAQLRSINVLDLLGRHTQALHAVQQLEERGDNADIQRSAYLEEAQLAARAGNTGQERAVYARALTAFPDDVDLLYARALSWEQHDDIVDAESDLRRCLVGSPDHPAVLNALGYLLADHTTRYSEALVLIERARAAAPNNPIIIDSYGWLLFKMGRLTEAYAVLQHAWSLNHDPDIGAHLGEVAWKIGDRQQAQTYFAAVRRMDPTNRVLRRALLDCRP